MLFENQGSQLVASIMYLLVWRGHRTLLLFVPGFYCRREGHFIPRHYGMAGCVSSTARHDTRRITNDSKRRPVSPASHTAGVQYSKITTDRQHTVITRPLPMREILPFNIWNKYVQRVDGSFKRYTISGASSDAPRCSALHLAHLFSYSLSLLFSCRGKTQENVILQISRKQLHF